jgi:outer membrane receptor protein involved in Fe transport
LDLRVGLRGFWDQIDDYQFNQSVPLSTDFIILNADEVTSRGVELDAAWAPVERLTVRGSLGYVMPTFESYDDPFTPESPTMARKSPSSLNTPAASVSATISRAVSTPRPRSGFPGHQLRCRQQRHLHPGCLHSLGC